MDYWSLNSEIIKFTLVKLQEWITKHIKEIDIDSLYTNGIIKMLLLALTFDESYNHELLIIIHIFVQSYNNLQVFKDIVNAIVVSNSFDFRQNSEEIIEKIFETQNVIEDKYSLLKIVFDAKNSIPSLSVKTLLQFCYYADPLCSKLFAYNLIERLYDDPQPFKMLSVLAKGFRNYSADAIIWEVVIRLVTGQYFSFDRSNVKLSVLKPAYLTLILEMLIPFYFSDTITTFFDIILQNVTPLLLELPDIYMQSKFVPYFLDLILSKENTDTSLLPIIEGMDKEIANIMEKTFKTFISKTNLNIIKEKMRFNHDKTSKLTNLITNIVLKCSNPEQMILVICQFGHPSIVSYVIQNLLFNFHNKRINSTFSRVLCRSLIYLTLKRPEVYSGDNIYSSSLPIIKKEAESNQNFIHWFLLTLNDISPEIIEQFLEIITKIFVVKDVTKLKWSLFVLSRIVKCGIPLELPFINEFYENVKRVCLKMQLNFFQDMFSFEKVSELDTKSNSFVEFDSVFNQNKEKYEEFIEKNMFTLTEDNFLQTKAVLFIFFERNFMIHKKSKDFLFQKIDEHIRRKEMLDSVVMMTKQISLSQNMNYEDFVSKTKSFRISPFHGISMTPIVLIPSEIDLQFSNEKSKNSEVYVSENVKNEKSEISKTENPENENQENSKSLIPENSKTEISENPNSQKSETSKYSNPENINSENFENQNPKNTKFSDSKISKPENLENSENQKLKSDKYTKSDMITKSDKNEISKIYKFKDSEPKYIYRLENKYSISYSDNEIKILQNIYKFNSCTNCVFTYAFAHINSIIFSDSKLYYILLNTRFDENVVAFLDSSFEYSEMEKIIFDGGFGPFTTICGFPCLIVDPEFSLILPYHKGVQVFSRNSGNFIIEFLENGFIPTVKLDISNYLEKFSNGEMSVLEFLNVVNVAAERSYSDMSCYPIFPKVSMNMNGISFRDLKIPIQLCAEFEKSKSLFQARYEVQKYHHAENLSNPQYISSCLFRYPPYSESQFFFNGKWDAMSRIFVNVENQLNVTSKTIYEAFPEIYCFYELLDNKNQIKIDGKLVEVKFPPKIEDSRNFVRWNRINLEGVSNNICSWLDLVFGVDSRGERSLALMNTFHPNSYDDENFSWRYTSGCVPKQVFFNKLKTSIKEPSDLNCLEKSKIDVNQETEEIIVDDIYKLKVANPQLHTYSSDGYALAITYNNRVMTILLQNMQPLGAFYRAGTLHSAISFRINCCATAFRDFVIVWNLSTGRTISVIPEPNAKILSFKRHEMVLRVTKQNDKIAQYTVNGTPI
ncbi:Beige/BEACH domain containing protein [Trichomonas vaginalis G3]|uniref:Beige/BEACH domain containing protein n=1 Tax=Trichomonas vaginalis (strain ATCC PRA-98 / G3) TaxID=412133 RepID=A2E682_TRIV3|nr:platelet formation protein family [Trichomonas vaginalis G3]EAY11805.1 Beige/BEACH domain containing protein [Trichomonas vaginalis G3]KAI5534211.1 platelet formation protein family [Trichomonas vaginalis G3]|eukprot:XP_001324028.1 Beige/BEACH domain containing protein [Trichomonas vaginalis G3]